MFADRIDAGRRLGQALGRYRQGDATVVLGIPRGGLVVASQVAGSLNLAFGIAAVRKVGAPGNPELALGAVHPDSEQVLDLVLGRRLGLSAEDLGAAAEGARRRLRAWLTGMPEGRQPRPGENVILVDDGVATGYTAEVAIHALRRQRVACLTLAVPVAPAETLARLRSQVDYLVCLETPEPFHAVGSFFGAWPEVTDDQVRALLLSGNSM